MDFPELKSFDPEVLSKSLHVLEVQDILIYTTEENLEAGSNIIFQKLVNQEITPLDYSYILYPIERYNSLKCKIFCKLTARVCQLLQINNDKILQELKFEILERIFFILDFESTPHIMLYFLVKEGFYEGKDFLDRIIELKRKSCDSFKFTLPFIVWFMPLFEEYDHEFYEETLFQLQRKDEFYHFNEKVDDSPNHIIKDDEKDEFFNFYVDNNPSDKYDINKYSEYMLSRINHNDFNDQYGDLLEYQYYNRIEPYGKGTTFDSFDLWFFRPEIFNEFKKDDWKSHHFLCEHGYFPNSIEEAIFNDDLEKFLEFLKKSTLTFTSTINYNIFYTSHVISEKTNLIEYAAFCSSVKIFKYLINSMSQDDIVSLSQYSLNFSYLTTYSGCIEILKICEQYNFDITSSLFCAACFYKHEILNWLVEEKNFSVELYSKNYLCPLHQSASSNNLRGLLYLLWKGADINKNQLDDGQKIYSPTLFGIEFNRYHTVSLLLSSNKMNKIDSRMIDYAGIYCDLNLFLKVFDRFEDKETYGFPIFNHFADFKTAKYFFEHSEYDDIDSFYIVCNFLDRKKYKLASLYFDAFRDQIVNNKRILEIFYLSNDPEAIKLFINDPSIAKNKRLIYLTLLRFVANKHLNIIKLLLLKMKEIGEAFIMKDLLDIFDRSVIEDNLGNCTTLFFKVFEYDRNEFY